MLNSIMRCMPMLHNGLQIDKNDTNDTCHSYAQEYLHIYCIQKSKHMTLAISMLIIIFPLHTKMQDYHLKYPIVLLYMS